MSGGGTRSGRRTGGGAVNLDDFTKKFKDVDYTADFQINYKDGTTSEVYRLTLDEKVSPETHHRGYDPNDSFIGKDWTPMFQNPYDMSLYSFKDNEAGRKIQGKVGMKADAEGKISEGLNKVRYLGRHWQGFKKEILRAVGKKEDEVDSIKIKKAGRFVYDDTAYKKYEARRKKIDDRLVDSMKYRMGTRGLHLDELSKTERAKLDKENAAAWKAYKAYHDNPPPAPPVYRYEIVKP